jgi:hypothetical protein
MRAHLTQRTYGPLVGRLLAGAALPSQQRSAGDPAQWFEGDNARLGGQFTEQAPDARFNDRLRRLESHD